MKLRNNWHCALRLQVMTDGWLRVPLGQLATLECHPVKTQATDIYQSAGVLNGGQGLFAREPLSGNETKYPSLHQLRAGQIVMRKLTAWEGTVTVVPSRFDGFFVSTEFPTFSIDRSRLLPEFMGLICQQPWFWGELRDRCKGTVQRRKRVYPSQLLEIPIPLPPLPHQARIVDLLSRVDSLTNAADAEVRCAEDLSDGLRNETFATATATGTLGDLVDVTNGRQRSPLHASGPYMVQYIRAANVKDGRLVLDDPMYMNFTPTEQQRYQLSPGDVLVTEGCGSLAQIGATCRWNGEVPGIVCFQNHLVRLRIRETSVAGQSLLYEWARWAFKTGQFAALATGTSIFSLGATRIAKMRFPIIPADQHEATSALLSASDKLVRQAISHQIAVNGLRDALLTELLTGKHAIPDAYEALFEAS